MEDITIDKVFIGSCTNSRIEDLRSAARVVLSQGAEARVAANVHAMIVPGSGLIKQHAEAEGLDVVFKRAGFDWREAGCSMCLGMNPDQLAPGQRCASTSNRNFEGRQGSGGRTHLMSPAMAAAAALTGRMTDVRKLVDVSGAKTEEKGAESPKVSVVSAFDFFTDPVLPPPAPLGHVPSEEPAAPAPATTTTPASLPEVPASTKSTIPKFTIVSGIAAPLEMENVDTDMIIPKQFLKTLKRTGLGQGLFDTLRKDPKTGERTDFVLNRSPFDKAVILVVTGVNFGCGSSREHAPWSL